MKDNTYIITKILSTHKIFDAKCKTNMVIYKKMTNKNTILLQ